MESRKAWLGTFTSRNMIQLQNLLWQYKHFPEANAPQCISTACTQEGTNMLYDTFAALLGQQKRSCAQILYLLHGKILQWH